MEETPQMEVRGTAGRSIALGRGGEAVAPLVGVEFVSPSQPPQKVFTGGNRIRYGINLVLSSIADMGLCSANFYHEWKGILSSLAGAFGRPLEEVAVVAAYYSPQTHAAQNMVGAIAQIAERRLKSSDPESVRAWANQHNLPEDAIAALKSFVDEQQGKPLPAQIANIIKSNQKVVDAYFQLKDLLEEAIEKQGGEGALDNETIANALQALIQREGLKEKYGVSAELVNRFEKKLKDAGVLGEDERWYQSSKAQALFPVLLQKGEPFFREMENEKVVNFLWNILFPDTDFLPTMDTRMMEAFGLFADISPDEREAIREALFSKDIYKIWVDEAYEYFAELQQELHEVYGISLSIPQIQSAIWQTIRSYSDRGLIGRNAVPFTFAHLFPRTTAALLERAVRPTMRYTTREFTPVIPEQLQQLITGFREGRLTDEEKVNLFRQLKTQIENEKKEISKLNRQFSQIEKEREALSAEEAAQFVQYRKQAEAYLRQQLELLQAVKDALPKGALKEDELKLPAEPSTPLPVGVFALLRKMFGDEWKQWSNLKEKIRTLLLETQQEEKGETKTVFVPKDKETLRKEHGFEWRLTEEEEDVAAQFRKDTKPLIFTEATLKGVLLAKEEAQKAIVPKTEKTPPLFDPAYEQALEGMRAIIRKFIPDPTKQP